jgi:PAS domain S-box-containing protein
MRFRRAKGLVAPALISLILVPALLLTVALGIGREFRQGEAVHEAVNRSYEVRLQMQTVFSLIQDAETGQRGFLVTGDDRFLDPYNSAIDQLAGERARLRAMIRGDQPSGAPATQAVADLDALDRLIDQRLAIIRQGLDIYRQDPVRGRSGPALSEGKRVMDDIRLQMARMTRDNSARLAEQVAADAARTQQTQTLTVVLFVTLGLLLFGATALILRQALSRQKLLDGAQASAARLRATFDSAHDGVVTFNRSGSIEGINRAGEAMYGYTAGELSRRDAALLFDRSDSADPFGPIFDGPEASGHPVREFVARRKDGTTFPAEVTFGRFALPDGDHVIAAIRDVSERRRAERLKSEFVSTVSHELRTPLTSIAGSLGLLVGGAGGALDDRAARLIGIAHANCQRLVRLINDILDIEKIESGQVAFAMTPLSLGGLVRTTVESMQGFAAELGVTLALRVEPDAPLVRADPDRLSQVVTNLLSNAAKVSPRGGTVEIAVAPATNRRVRISVRDHGSGVPEDFRERIFSKFAQADGSDSRRMAGTGLGLAITREIVERHGGRVWFESPPDGGALFLVELPAYDDVQADAARGGSKVLICEDDPDAAATLAAMMAELGMTSVTVGTIQAAEETLTASPDFAVMLLDLRLPDGTGLELLHRIRADKRLQSLPVLIISGEAGRAPLALDIVDWLQKPVDPSLLKSAVESLRNGAGGRPLILHVEDDPDLRQLVAETLAPNFDIVTADSLAAARELLKQIKPKLAILDIALVDGSGLELLGDLRRQERRVPVVVFSAQPPGDTDIPAAVDAVLTKSRTSLDYLADTVGRLVARPATGNRA